jgi:hypothetical protein
MMFDTTVVTDIWLWHSQEARRATERAYDVPRVDDKVNRAVSAANKAANAARVAAVKAAQKRIPNHGDDLPLSIVWE